jgi:hypothetical protein
MDCRECEKYKSGCRIIKDYNETELANGECGCFTPKPAEKVEKKCATCRIFKLEPKVRQNHCWRVRELTIEQCWQPIPTQATPEEKVRKSAMDFINELETVGTIGNSGKVKWLNPQPPKRKDKKMIKKVRHLMRMAAVLWLLIGVWKICVFANPLVAACGQKIWNTCNPQLTNEYDAANIVNIIASWTAAFLGISIVVGISIALNKFTKWFFGEK